MDNVLINPVDVAAAVVASEDRSGVPGVRSVFNNRDDALKYVEKLKSDWGNGAS